MNAPRKIGDALRADVVAKWVNSLMFAVTTGLLIAVSMWVLCTVSPPPPAAQETRLTIDTVALTINGQRMILQNLTCVTVTQDPTTLYCGASGPYTIRQVPLK